MKAPFCTTPAAEQAFERWAKRLEAAGVELEEPDVYVVALAASREARLQELTEALAKAKGASRRARIVSQERLAAADMAKALEMLERTFGASVGEAVEPVAAVATGTDGRVVPFRAPGLSPRAQALVLAVTKAGAPTKGELRAAVRGSQGDFLKALREAMKSGAIERHGVGSRAHPYRYRATKGA